MLCLWSALWISGFPTVKSKGSQLGAFCPYAIVYCYLGFKLHYLKNLKLLSVRVKELFEPVVLRGGGKLTGFCSF